MCKVMVEIKMIIFLVCIGWVELMFFVLNGDLVCVCADILVENTLILVI